MPTKRGARSTDALERFNEALRRPHTWRIPGIDAFWLEDAAGDPLTEEFTDESDVFAAALVAMNGRADVEDVFLVGRRTRGSRTVLTNGLILQDLAEASAGIPARPRVARE